MFNTRTPNVPFLVHFGFEIVAIIFRNRIDHYPLPTFHYFMLIVCCAKMTEIARFVLKL